MVPLVAGVFGILIGSFLNVVILRRGARALDGRSACTSCGHTLAWYDLVPVFSWLMLGARCRYCGSVISWQYPAVEAATASIFALIAGSMSISLLGESWQGSIALALYCAVAALLVCVFVYDLRHTIIPDAWAYSFAALAFAAQFVQPYPGGFSWFMICAGPFAAAPLFALWAVSKGKWMGFGDVKLALGIGWLLGPVSGVFAVFAAFVLGSVLLVPVMLAEKVTHMHGVPPGTRGLTMKSEVPFGPFLIAATLIVWISALYGFDVPAFVGWVV